MKKKNNKKRKKNNKKNDTIMFRSHSKKYNLNWLNEYKMMREELVNYMEKLQTVRNMMYITIGAVFTLSISKELPFFCALLPLLFILPAYTTAVDYWVCVRKASAYLVVFHESYEDCPIHWESRHGMLKKIRKRKNFKKSIFRNIPLQLTSYYTCSATTIIIYILRLYKYVDQKKSLKPSLNFWSISIDGIPILVYIVTGFIITIFLVVFFICFSMGESYDSFLKKFLLIKYREEQCEIGKRWIDKIFNEKDIEYPQEICQIIDKYL